MARLELLQLDSVPVLIRTQYLPLFSRLGAYKTSLLDEIAYADDEWFEAWSHEASLLPVSTEPWLRWSKARAQQGETWRHLHALAKKDPGYIDAVLEEVRGRGPLAPADLSDPRPKRRGSSGWGTGSQGANALDWLFRIGRVGVRRGAGFTKSFDLLERIIPPDVLDQPTPDLDAALDELLLRAGRAHGVGTADCLVDYFRLPVRPAKARLEVLVADGRLARCEVEGWAKPAYRHPDAPCPRAISAASLLSPFDPVVWNRKRIEALFGFDYRLEIYTPAPKRRFGYYVLPFLLGDRLVGRLDLKFDRERQRLMVPAAHLESHAQADAVGPAAALELETLRRFVGAEDIQIGRRGNLARALKAEIARPAVAS